MGGDDGGARVEVISLVGEGVIGVRVRVRVGVGEARGGDGGDVSQREHTCSRWSTVKQ